jgi:hypothetical protein
METRRRNRGDPQKVSAALANVDGTRQRRIARHVSRIVPACPAALIVIWLTAARESRLETNRARQT